MKLKLFLLLSAIGLVITGKAQVPAKFAFQGLARNSSGQAVANKAISVRFTIHEGSEAGATVFQETHTPTTNANGVFNVAVGSGVAGGGAENLITIKWAAATYYLQVEIDPAGGSAYTTISTSQLLSVPYAIWAGRVAVPFSTVTEFTGATLNGASNKALAEMATAMGNFTTASGTGAVAMGIGTTASGIVSTSMGNATKATGDYALATGSSTEASGEASLTAGKGSKATNANAVAMGNEAQANGNTSFALGSQSIASASSSFAIGSAVTASGQNALALGYYTVANGARSTAMGSYVSTNGYGGSFIIGDNRSVALNSSAANQMTMRFAGGYRLFTSPTGDGSTVGVTLGANSNSWSSISDSTKKENYLAANGAAFLSKIKGMKLGSWNYKGQDKAQYRHYGPMAQEFYSLFGNDGTGIIGNDTTIASADIDGVMMIALQALIKESAAMRQQVTQLNEANKALLKRVQQLEAARKEN
ncbi:tail fiber domain-containing protein [Niabella sp. CC-SYL272]|uniref:tail fiber domain-containing protein n=1 Tax=Niabella agricola TaxID=2891571 RepID=UPI001F1B8F6E|nr:tail fiber domain-containing protein [Niabella agricola]MCF3109752.1 tail fiber domain-containing protein [Niabella agricola]